MQVAELLHGMQNTCKITQLSAELPQEQDAAALKCFFQLAQTAGDSIGEQCVTRQVNRSTMISMISRSLDSNGNDS